MSAQHHRFLMLCGPSPEPTNAPHGQMTLISPLTDAALVQLPVDAELLVVGSRGRGGFSELLLGSVSHAAALPAVCPVVVVPSSRDKR
jgi:Universal stress protein family